MIKVFFTLLTALVAWGIVWFSVDEMNDQTHVGSTYMLIGAVVGMFAGAFEMWRCMKLKIREIEERNFKIDAARHGLMSVDVDTTTGPTHFVRSSTEVLDTYHDKGPPIPFTGPMTEEETADAPPMKAEDDDDEAFKAEVRAATHESLAQKDAPEKQWSES